MIMGRHLPFVLSVVSLFAFSLLFANVALAQTSSCVRATPLLEYSNPSSGSFSDTANSQSGGITVAHTYTIKVTNKDSSGCGGSTFQFNFGTPPLYVTLDGKNQPFFASIKTIPAGQSAEVTGKTGNVGLNLVKSPQTFEIPVVVSRLLEAKTPSLDSTTVKSVTQGSYTMTVGFDKPSYAGGGTAAYFGTLKKNGVVFSGKAVSVQIFKTKSGVESMESQTSLTTATDGSFSGKITIDTLASKYRLIARYTDSSSPTSPVTVTLINSFCGSSDCSKSFGSVPAATNENPSGTIKLKIVVTRELSCLNTKGYEPAITIRSQTGTRDIVSGQELTFDVSVLNREVDCPDERFGSPLVGVADRTDPLRPIETEDTGAKVWEVRIDGNSPSRQPSTSTTLPGISKAKFFLWQDFGIKDYTLKSYASASHRLTLKAPLAPEEVGNTRNFAFCISSISQICQTILVKVLPSSTGDKTPPSIISFSTNPSPAVVSKPVTFVAKVSDNAAVDKVVFSVDRNKNGGFDTSEIQTKTLSPKITSGEVSADSPVTFDSIGTYKYKIDVFDTSNNPSSSEGTITVGDGTTPPLSVGGTSNTGSGGDKIELSLDKGSYAAGELITVTGTLTLKTESVVSPYVNIEFFDSAGKSVHKADRPAAGGSFALKRSLDSSVTGQVKVVASYVSTIDSKTLVSVEKLISIGGQVSPGTPPPSGTSTPATSPTVSGSGTQPVSGTNTEGDEIKISAEKDSYKRGERAKLSGTVTSKSGPIKDATVEIQLVKPDGTIVATTTKTTDSSGSFTFGTFFENDAAYGNWKFVAIAKYSSKSLSVEKIVSLTKTGSVTTPPSTATAATEVSKTETQNGYKITLKVDKSSYKKGEYVSYSGVLQTEAGSPVSDAKIEIEINKKIGSAESFVVKSLKTTSSAGEYTGRIFIEKDTDAEGFKLVAKYPEKSVSIENSFTISSEVTSSSSKRPTSYPEVKTKKEDGTTITDGVSIATDAKSYKIGDYMAITVGVFSEGKPLPNAKIDVVFKNQDKPDGVFSYVTDSEGKVKGFVVVDSKIKEISASFQKDSQTYIDKIEITVQ